MYNSLYVKSRVINRDLKKEMNSHYSMFDFVGSKKMYI